jgi:hypothetical protein
VNLKPEVVPTEVGVPVMAPVELLSVAHDGKVPLVRLQV